MLSYIKQIVSVTHCHLLFFPMCLGQELQDPRKKPDASLLDVLGLIKKDSLPPLSARKSLMAASVDLVLTLCTTVFVFYS